MRNAKAKFADLSRVLLDEPSEVEAEQEATHPAVKTASQKAVKTSSRPSPRPMRLAKPAPSVAETPRSHAEQRGEEDGGEPRRQMTVKLPLSLYARLSDEKSRRVVAKNKNWSIQDIITEALDRHLRTN